MTKYVLYEEALQEGQTDVRISFQEGARHELNASCRVCFIQSVYPILELVLLEESGERLHVLLNLVGCFFVRVEVASVWIVYPP